MNRAEYRRAARKNKGQGSEARFADAVAFHEAGRMAEAEALYRVILNAEPHNADALHLLGLVHFQTGRAEQAIRFIHDAIAQDTNVAG